MNTQTTPHSSDWEDILKYREMGEVKKDTLSKSQDGTKTILATCGSNESTFYIVKEFPKQKLWTINERNKELQSMLSSSSNEVDFFCSNAYFGIGFTDTKSWCLFQTITSTSKNVGEHWKSIVLHSSPFFSKDDNITGAFPPLFGRNIFLCALTEEENQPIIDILKCLKDCLIAEEHLGFWRLGDSQDTNTADLKSTFELLFHGEEQPLKGTRVSDKDRWHHPRKILGEEITRIEKIAVDTFPNDEVEIPYANRSHGDLWIDNFAFAFTDAGLKIYLIDPLHMVVRNNENITCVKYPDVSGQNWLYARNLYQHKEKPLPNPLHDLAMIVSSIIMSLSFQSTRSQRTKRNEADSRYKNKYFKDRRIEFREAIISAISNNSNQNSEKPHITNNLHTFFSGIDSILNEIIIGGYDNRAISKEDNHPFLITFDLMLYDRLLFYAGFILAELKDKKKKIEELTQFLSDITEILFPKDA